MCVAAHPSSECCLVKKVTFVQKMLLPSHLKCISKHYNCTDIVQCSAVYIYVCLSHLHVHRSVHCHWAFLQVHLPPQLLWLLHTHLTNWLQAIDAIGSVDHTVIQDWLSLSILEQSLCVHFFLIWPYPSYSSDFTLATSNTLHSIQNFNYVSVPSLAHPLGLISFNPTLTLLPSLFSFIYSRSPPLPFNC